MRSRHGENVTAVFRRHGHRIAIVIVYMLASSTSALLGALAANVAIAITRFAVGTITRNTAVLTDGNAA